MTKARWTALSAVLLLLVAAADYFTTVELHFSIFYFIPIALIAWYGGRELGFAAAVLAAVAWWVVEVSSAGTYTTPLLAGGNYALRLVAFIVIAITASRLRRARDREKQLNAALEGTIAKLQSSMAEINELRDQMQLVCAWTNRIKSEGHWVPMDRFLADKLHLKISHGISEEAAERFFSASVQEHRPEGGRQHGERESSAS